MATQGRRTDAALEDRLWREPWHFEFFQAVRLLELAARTKRQGDAQAELAPVGYDRGPGREVVRFKPVLSRSFPAAEIVKLSAPTQGESEIAEMQVAFMGLTGPAGVLPEYYLDLLQQRVREKDDALRDFFDLFNHRTISLFYRAWEKYRFTVGYERTRCSAKGIDPFTQLLKCLIGAGTGKQENRLAVADGTLLAYAGHLSHYPRSMVVLETVLADYLQLPVKIDQFVGRWLPLEADQCTRLPSVRLPRGQFSRLGADAVIGSQVWDRQSKFCIRLGPLARERFNQFLPIDSENSSHLLVKLAHFTREYVGLEFDFDVRLVLRAGEKTPLQLCRSGDGAPYLGWNTWLGSAIEDRARDDAHFSAENL